MARSKNKVKTVSMAITDLDVNAVIEFGSQNRNKKTAYSFLNEFKNQSETEIEETVTGLWKMLMNCLENDKGKTAKEWAVPNSKKLEMDGQLIQVTIDIALLTLQLKFYFTSHIELAVLLNSILPFLPDSVDSLKNSIAQYCEKLCLTKPPDNADYSLFNVFPYLFQRTLRPKGLKTDVKRIYAIRAHLASVMNFGDTKKDEMWNYFEQAITAPQYLSILEGQKIIALAMTLDPDKIAELHKKVTERLYFINALKHAPAYGRIYFEAWCYSIKHDRNDIKDEIEITCLQQFLDLAITSRKRIVLTIARKILAEFHYHKKEEAVTNMLLSLYQPILWRYLKNPDGFCRANTAQIFLDIFPFEETDAKLVTNQNDLNIQLNMIRELLEDDFPVVRVSTLLNLCISLSVNWEIFPEETIKSYLKLMINDLSRDGAHPQIRCAVIKGLKCLLENPLSLRSLAPLLPKTGHLFHDISEEVRIAYCQVLLKVKTISAIKYFDIVSPDQLLARLAEECPPVQKSIVNLLNNSYFPVNQNIRVWLARCLEILKNRDASRVLFTHIHLYVEFKKLVDFMIQAIKSLHFYVSAKNASGPTVSKHSNKENIANMDEYMNNLEQAVGYGNLETVSALMEAVVIMWLSLKQEMEMKIRRHTLALNRYAQPSASALLKRRYTEMKKEIVEMEEENKGQLKSFVGKVKDDLADLCLYYKDTKAWEAVSYTASFLPPNDVPSLGSLLFWKLKNLPLDSTPEEYIPLVECLCNQRQAKELLNLLKEWLEIGLSNSYVEPPPAKKRKKNKRTENFFYDQPKPYLANRILDSILITRNLQKCVFPFPKDVIEIIDLFDYVKRKLEKFNARVMTETEANFLGLLMYNIVRLAIFLKFYNELDGAKRLNEIAEWTEQKLVPHLAFSHAGTENYVSLIHIICMNLCRGLSDSAGFGFLEPKDEIPFLHFEQLLTSELGYKYALIAARFLYKYTASSLHSYLDDDETDMYENLLLRLPRILEIFNNETLLESIPTQDYKEVEFTLGNMMQVLINIGKVFPGLTAKVFESVLSNLINSVLEKTNVIVEELSDEPFDEIVFPKVGAFFTYMVNQKPKLLPTYLKFLTRLYKRSSQDISHWIAYWAVLRTIFVGKVMTKFILNQTNILVYSLEKTLYKLYPRKKTSGSSSPQEEPPAESPKMQLFQNHCHAEFLKLKNRQFSKVASAKGTKLKRSAA